MILIIRTSILIFIVTALSACYSVGSERLSRAEALSRERRFSEAIALYREHIAARLKVEDRPTWENPYFYLVIIGDLYLEEGNYLEALIAYEHAEKMQVDAVLVADRYRYIARKFEDRGQYRQALAVLERYRVRDTILYDLMLDRIGKKLSDEES
jgi:tetratricopeptide (TPR) repeat protein